MLDQFAKEVKNGALVNRAVSEADTVVPLWWKTCYACNKTKDGYKLNGVKTFTSMSKALTHYIVAHL